MTLTQSFVIDIERGLFEEKSEFSLVTGDKNSHKIVQYFREDDERFCPEKVTCYFVRPDNKAVLLNTELDDNCCATTLSQFCYSKCGIGALVTRCYHGPNGLITVSKILFRIEHGFDAEIIDPEGTLPSTEELEAAISRLEALTSEIQTKLDQGEFDGETPYIGENGHWWIGETDTGVSATPAGSGGEVVGFEVGDNLYMSPERRLSVLTTDNAEEDNTRPMTSAGVYVQLGNILTILGTI